MWIRMPRSSELIRRRMRIIRRRRRGRKNGEERRGYESRERTRDVGREVVERVPSDDVNRTSSSRKETPRTSERVPEIARRRKEGEGLDQDMEESRITSSPEQHYQAPSTEKASRGREARVEEYSRQGKEVDEVSDESRVSDQDEPPWTSNASRVEEKQSLLGTARVEIERLKSRAFLEDRQPCRGLER